MAPPTALLNVTSSASADNYERPSKRVKIDDSRAVEDLHEVHQRSAVRRHPLGVRPSGNAFTSSVNLKDAAGHFTNLPDELLIQLMECLDAPTLLRLGSSCRALHAFTRTEDLWRTLFVE